MSAERSVAAAPFHVVYGGAHLFRRDTVPKLGAIALRTLDAHVDDANDLGSFFAVEGPQPTSERLQRRWDFTRRRLRERPIDDLRIDFEDGYGPRSDAEEDEHATTSAVALARALSEGTAPPWVGIRVKALSPATSLRASRTLERFVTTLCEHNGGRLAPRFVVTLPKVGAADEVASLARQLDALEATLGLAPRSIRVEAMIETPTSLIAPDGRVAAPRVIDAGDGRLDALHLGLYDLASSLGLGVPDDEVPASPVMDAARAWLQAVCVPRGVRVSDGAVTRLPVLKHPVNPALGDAQRDENRGALAPAWRSHYAAVRRSLAFGVWQGWDLHPNQLVSRWAALHDALTEGGLLDASVARLRAFLDASAKALRSGGTFDDAATARMHLATALRAVDLGVITADALATALAVNPGRLRARSFDALQREGTP